MIVPLHKWPELQTVPLVSNEITKLAFKDARADINGIYHAPLGGSDAARVANEKRWTEFAELADRNAEETGEPDQFYATCMALKKRLKLIKVGLTVEAALAVLSLCDTIGQCVALVYALNHQRANHQENYVTVATLLNAFLSGPPKEGEIQRYLRTFPSMDKFDDMGNTTNWPRGEA